MPVSNPTTVDQVAQAPDGRVLLAMTEDRRYADGDVELMSEQFRQKLNAYVFMIRSGQLRESVGAAVDRGVEVRLFCYDEPPSRVKDIVRLATEGLSGEGVVVDWTVHAPLTTAQLFDVIGSSLVDRAPAGSQRIDLVATLVGDGLAGGLTARLSSGDVVPLNPDESLVTALRELKRACWQSDAGTWVTFRASIEGDQLQPSFDHEEPPGGAGQFPRRDWEEELRRFPRPTVPTWWQAQLT